MSVSYPIENRPSEKLETPQTAPTIGAEKIDLSKPEIDEVEPEGGKKEQPEEKKENSESNVTVPESKPGFQVKQQIAPDLEGRSMGTVGPK